MKKYITFPKVEGNASRQAHADMPEGTYEREVSREGFFGPASHLHHKHPPTSWSDRDGPLKPRAFDTNKASTAPSPWQAPTLLHNAHCKMRYWKVQGDMDTLARNGDGDELLFIHTGHGELFCDYGHMSFRDGDYIVIPRGTMWRLECAEATEILMVEATNDIYHLPDKGLVGPHAIFDPAMLDTPKIDKAFKAQYSDSDPWQVKIKKNNDITTVSYDFNPLDVVGWHGDVSVVRINWRDIRPLMSHRYHLPPSAHTTFVANRFVICTFVPRPFETDEGALKVPFFHNNDDFDEVLFYHAGNFFSRDNIHPGMMTLHPAGFAHGPHPKALKNMLKQPSEATEEVAVMVDTRDPLEVGGGAVQLEWNEYVNSWKEK